MTATKQLEGYVIKRGEGKEYYFGHEHLLELKAPEGLAEVQELLPFELASDAGAEIPPHIHRDDDELHYLLEGSATYTVGEQTLEAGPGSLVFLPKQVAHALTIGPSGARWLWLARPKMHGLADEIAVPVTEPDAKKRAGDLAENEELVVEVFAKYGMDFVAPEGEEA